MTAQELLNIVRDFENYYIQSDINSTGCDCWCGGDSYTAESWSEMCKSAEECYEKYKAACEELNIEWDYE